jgi:hypothetical protein
VSTVALLLAGGVAFFVGAALLAVTAALRSNRGTVQVLQRLCAAAAIILIAASATPLPLWLYIAIGALLILWCVVDLAKLPPSRRHLRTVVRVALPLALAVAVACEWRGLAADALPPGNHHRLFVIGDSMSAPDVAGQVPWPQRVANAHNLDLTNLARAGATTAAARAQADQLGDQDGVVVVAIGGNDMIGGNPVADFRRDLDHILSVATAHGRPVIMLELPLLPWWIRYGYVQRHLAARYGVHLIPKRHFAAVLAQRGNTTDGLHLSARGHEALAQIIWPYVSPACAAGTIASNGSTEVSQ